MKVWEIRFENDKGFKEKHFLAENIDEALVIARKWQKITGIYLTLDITRAILLFNIEYQENGRVGE